MKQFLFLFAAFAAVACLLFIAAPTANACPGVSVGHAGHVGYSNYASPSVAFVAPVVVQQVQPVQQQINVAAVQPQTVVAAPQQIVTQQPVYAVAQPTLAVLATPVFLAQQYDYGNVLYNQNVGFAFNSHNHHVGQVFGNNGHHGGNGQVVVAAPQNAKVVVNVKNGRGGR